MSKSELVLWICNSDPAMVTIINVTCLLNLKYSMLEYKCVKIALDLKHIIFKDWLWQINVL